MCKRIVQDKSAAGAGAFAKRLTIRDRSPEPLRMADRHNAKKRAAPDSSHHMIVHELDRPAKHRSAVSTQADPATSQTSSTSHERPLATVKEVVRSGGHTSSAAPQTQPTVTTDRFYRGGRGQEFIPSLPGTARTRMDPAGTGSSRPAFNVYDEDSELFLQPETRPITQEQLVNEVKGIYAGLVMVERKCVEIDQQQAMTTNKLSNEQWQALIALHRTLLHEHHDFLASQHPSSSPALRRLATKYAMPARMWRHGIHSFLELLRHRLPDTLEHMLSFVYLAYSMMALLMESVPSFEETWIECLDDLARYRMAIEEADLCDREIWSGVARMWYDKAADKSPNIGRIQHHLALLARPNIAHQLLYYTKAIASVAPFLNARESIMLLFNPFLEGVKSTSQRSLLVESAFVKCAAILFTRGSISEYTWLEECIAVPDYDFGRVAARLRIPTYVSSAFLYVEACIPWAQLVSFLNASVMPGIDEILTEEFPKPKSGTGRQLPEDFIMRGLAWSSYYYPPGFFGQPLVDEDETSPQPAVTRTRGKESGLPSQNITAYTDRRRLEQGYFIKPTTISRRSGNRISMLRKVLHASLQLAAPYLVLSRIPVALAQEDCDITQMTTASSWITALFLTAAAGVAGQMTKENPTHAFGLSAWIFCAIAVTWDQLDPTTKFVAVAVALTPPLAVGLGQIRKRWHEGDFCERGRDAYPNARSEIHTMEAGDLDVQNDEDNDSFHWTGEPRQSVESTESPKNSMKEASRTDQYEDRDSSPEPWNGTEGFQR
jgi:Est1 DNA/RNA binding domain